MFTVSLPVRAQAELERRRRARVDEKKESPFVNPDPVEWMLEHFRVPETPDKRFLLAPYQVACLKEALRRDENGDFVYSTIVWGDIKKSIKSTVSAAVALWMAFNTEWGSVKIVANDLKQADSRAAYYARRCIELNPEMSKACKVKPSGYLIQLPNKTKIEAIPVDPKGEAGGNDDAVIYSELWAADSKAAMRLWTETTLSPTKYGKSFRWVETYAGFSGESPILEQLYDSGVNNGEKLSLGDFDPPLNVYANRAARLFCLWNQSPRLSWQTKEYYAQEAATLTSEEFRRVHRNEWVSSSAKFVPDEWWQACRAEIPPIDAREPIVVAMDAAVEQDCFGLVAIGGFGDGEYAVKFSRKWTPPKDGKIDFVGTEEDPGPETELRRLLNRYYVVEVCYDPYQLEDMAGRLSKELVAQMYAFKQGQERAIADKQLFDMIRDRHIHHGGDPELAEHISNANRKAEGDKIRIIKRSQKLKIDLAVCTSMGLDRAKFWQI